jgi:allantoinase
VLQDAKAKGLPVTVETCVHYLNFAAEEIPLGDTRFKCAPPIRGVANREKLWDGLVAGALDIVSTDHSPAPPELKKVEEGDFLAAWGGISGLQYALAGTWDGMQKRGMTPSQLTALWSTAPAKLLGISHITGELSEGKKADVVVSCRCRSATGRWVRPSAGARSIRIKKGAFH